jgi:hypothetical protein
MKKTILTAAAAALTLGFASGAHANKALSTEELVSYCATSNSETFTTCEIYSQGVYDTYLVFSQHRKAPKFVCVKQPAPSRKEVIQQYVEWANAHPKYAKDPAADSILRFLGERFPCGKAAK